MIAFDNLHGQFPSKRPEKIKLSWLLSLWFSLFFAESLIPQGACQATFFPTLTRLLSPLPMSLGLVLLPPRLPRSSTRWPPTLNWAMNNPKIRLPAVSHSNHQVITFLIIDGALEFAPENNNKSIFAVNPLTGELVGCPGVIIPEEKPVRSTTRVPPGGYTTPLW